MRAFAVLAAVLVAGCLTPEEPGGPAPPAPTTVSYEAIRFDTELGAFTILLYPEAAPETVALEKAFVAEKYYAGRSFGRTVPGHVIQVTPEPGQTEDTRTVPLETRPGYSFSMGAVGIARGEDPDSGGAEFFVMDFATSHLDANFTVWGQVVEGMDVVHKIARVPALDARPHGAIPFLAADRIAIDPVRITGTELVTLDLPVAKEKRLPLQVAKNVRAGDFRHSADWPADLRVGQASILGWYMRPYNLTEVPAASSLRIRVEGADLPVTEDPLARGAFTWTWTPARAGTHEATLVENGRTVATLVIRVPG